MACSKPCACTPASMPWWDAHWRRLAAGAQRLRMPLPDQARVRAEAAALFEDGGDGVLKLLVSRGGGEVVAMRRRPIAIPLGCSSRYPAAGTRGAAACARVGAKRGVSLQPALAGIKHCNRLEQVLARAECDDAGMRRRTDAAISRATSSARRRRTCSSCGGRWLADAAGGSMRRRRRLPGAPARRPWTRGRCGCRWLTSKRADAVFLCNAVRGILPLAQLATRDWPPHAAVAAAQQKLAALHPGFAIVGSSATEQP